MLDSTTKRRIDNLRDILVGKVPDPKSQVEQITIALIYKFMDDMDTDSVEMGGKKTFFAGKYAKYSWSNVFNPKLGGFELINMYGEAITTMNQNPNIPQLFRDIFKNAYLPYRDPETLKSFLKDINEFTYDHSEKLGDAFEYLLSVLGSQGDAGQFRTPRHIIDFIVEILEPKKNESILDPACGTAGFLISSFKHILKENSGKKALTPVEKKRLMQNFCGYDISPDMVRLSLVNLYLHGFPDPKIYEYDTLTSEERWNEKYDVILANPPFMTPKGGIKPHKKFSLQANRSEVLFVDYIAEHLNINGRAGIIVPEGIIFQSATAYKALRKMLVENYLYAVVSLPAGIFNPYSGVKTSILIMDKSLTKKTDKILFVKIESDGFDLGAQRRASDKNDLTGCLLLLQEYKQALQNNTTFESDNKNVFLIERKKIAEKDDYNLSIDRYREIENVKQSHFEIVELRDVIELIMGQAPLGSECNKTREGVPFVKVGQFGEAKPVIDEWTTNPLKLAKEGDVLICVVGATIGKLNLGIDCAIGRSVAALRPIKNKIEQIYLYHFLQGWIEKLRLQSQGSAQGVITKEMLYEIEIPLPPLSIQQQIVSKIESYQKIIDGAKQVTENYKPQIDIDASWKMVKLGEACEIKAGGTPSRDKEIFWGGNIPWLRSEACKDGQVNGAKEFISEKGFENSSAKWLNEKSTLIALVGATIGKTAFITFKSTTNQNVAGLYPNNTKNLLPEFLFYSCQNLYSQFVLLGEFRMANLSFVKGLEIPLPSISIQKEIVNRIDQEQQLVNSNKQLISIFEQKIKDEIGKLWQSEPKEYPTAEQKLSLAAEE